MNNFRHKHVTVQHFTSVRQKHVLHIANTAITEIMIIKLTIIKKAMHAKYSEKIARALS